MNGTAKPGRNESQQPQYDSCAEIVELIHLRVWGFLWRQRVHCEEDSVANRRFQPPPGVRAFVIHRASIGA
jgi:hypothetical protein